MRRSREDTKWDHCRRCGHYRIEHGTAETACRAKVLRQDDDGDPDSCTCRAFDVTT